MNVRPLAGVGLALGLFACSCQQRAGDFGGVVTGVASGAQIAVYGGDGWASLDTGDVVGFGDSVRVLNEGFVEIAFGDGDTIRLDQNTKATFDDIVDTTGERVIEVYDAYGVVATTVEGLPPQYGRYQVRTPDAIFEAHGTTFVVRYELNTRNAEVDVAKGEVWVATPSVPAPPVVVQPGHFAVVPFGLAALAPERIGLVRWHRVEKVTAPRIPLRRPSFYVAGPEGGPRAHRRLAPAHARRPHAPAPAAGAPSVKAPKVLKPAPRAHVEPRGAVRAPGKALGPKPAHKAPSPKPKPRGKAKGKPQSKEKKDRR